jgi:hypothetical protein
MPIRVDNRFRGLKKTLGRYLLGIIEKNRWNSTGERFT